MASTRTFCPTAKGDWNVGSSAQVAVSSFASTGAALSL